MQDGLDGTGPELGSGGRGRRRWMMIGIVAAAAAVAVALPVGLTQLGDDGEPPTLPPLAPSARLTAFDACQEFLSYVRGSAVEQTNAFGLGVPVPVSRPGRPGDAVPSAGRAIDLMGEGDSAAAAEPAPAPAAGGGFSGTNVQVAGIDEPDIVKTDGRLLVSVDGNRLRVVDARTPRLRGVLTFDEPVQELLLAGEHAVVFGDTELYYAYDVPEAAAAPAPAPADGVDGAARPVLPGPGGRGETTVTVVDLGDPDRPRVLRTFRFTGSRVAARVIDGRIRFVFRTDPPTLNWTYPDAETSVAAAEEANRRLVAATTVDDWLPRYEVEPGGGGSSAGGPIVACEDVLRPATPANLSMISVLTIDPQASGPGAATSVVGGGFTVYAEANALYVAGVQFPGLPVPIDPVPIDPVPIDPVPGGPVADGEVLTNDGDVPVSSDDAPSTVAVEPEDVTTQIHQFDVTDPEQARYVASGEVQGSLLNSYSLSARNGRLRVAVTRQSGGTSDSAVVVLEPRGDELVRIGKVGGLGVGERIYAVRFLGNVAWVVTYRQVDPLYAVDLSDPTRPTVRGELKLPGFSTYLLPLSDDRLLGIGESADGVNNATKLTMFDISDLSAPRLLDEEIVRGTLPQVGGDPHALLWWEPTSLAVVPIFGTWIGAAEGTGGGSAGTSVERSVEEPAHVEPDVRALAFRIAGPAISLLPERLGHDTDPAQVSRAVVVGDRIFAVSVSGMQVHDLTSLRAEAWLPW